MDEVFAAIANVWWAQFERGDFRNAAEFLPLVATCKSAYKVWNSARVISVDFYHPQKDQKKKCVETITKMHLRSALLHRGAIPGVTTSGRLLAYMDFNDCFHDDPVWNVTIFLKVAEHDKYGNEHNVCCFEAMQRGGAFAVIARTRDLDTLERAFVGNTLIRAIREANMRDCVDIAWCRRMFKSSECLFDALVEFGFLTMNQVSVKDIEEMFGAEYRSKALKVTGWNDHMDVDEILRVVGKTYLYFREHIDCVDAQKEFDAHTKIYAKFVEYIRRNPAWGSRIGIPKPMDFHVNTQEQPAYTGCPSKDGHACAYTMEHAISPRPDNVAIHLTFDCDRAAYIMPAGAASLAYTSNDIDADLKARGVRGAFVPEHFGDSNGWEPLRHLNTAHAMNMPVAEEVKENGAVLRGIIESAGYSPNDVEYLWAKLDRKDDVFKTVAIDFGMVGEPHDIELDMYVDPDDMKQEVTNSTKALLASTSVEGGGRAANNVALCFVLLATTILAAFAPA